MRLTGLKILGKTRGTEYNNLTVNYMKILFLMAFICLSFADTTLYHELQGFSENIKLILFANDDWEGDKMLPSNADYTKSCHELDEKYTEVTCMIVDSQNDETVWPLMEKANLARVNTPALMVH
jgi:hypothetical protein